MKALFRVSHSYSTKNKLEAAVYAYLKSIDRTLVDVAALALTKHQIIRDIEKINSEHPRCKPIQPSWYEFNRHFKGESNGDSQLYLVGICLFQCYITKAESTGINKDQFLVAKEANH